MVDGSRSTGTLIRLFEKRDDIKVPLIEKWFEKGLEIGLEICEALGTIRGKKQAKRYYVKKALKEGLPVKTIKRITGRKS